ncbi:MAG: hypothetical protein CL424_17065 [Acidimicrobiaceae bacterium]|nr:hypothetical protein [Acidimicrobiaceae bacterium]
MVLAGDRVEVDASAPCGIDRYGAPTRILRHNRERKDALTVVGLTRQPHGQRLAPVLTVQDVDINDAPHGER